METERKQQTAVEWLEAEFLKLEETIGVHGVMYELIEKAKEMEKQQIMDSANWGNLYADSNKSAEQYFNEKYGK